MLNGDISKSRITAWLARLLRITWDHHLVILERTVALGSPIDAHQAAMGGPLRWAFSGRFGFRPFYCDMPDLSGVFPGSSRRAFSSAIRRSAASRRCHSARIRVFFSVWLS
jgi:hypothetical protein